MPGIIPTAPRNTRGVTVPVTAPERVAPTANPYATPVTPAAVVAPVPASMSGPTAQRRAVTAPTYPSAPAPSVMAPIAYAMEKFQPTDNVFSAMAQGFVNSRAASEEEAQAQAKRDAAAEALAGHPDLQRMVRTGIMDVADGVRIGSARDETTKAETKKTAEDKRIDELLRQQGEDQLADMYANGLIDRPGLYKHLSPDPKDRKIEKDAAGVPRYTDTGETVYPTDAQAAADPNRPVVGLTDAGTPDTAQQEAFLETLNPEDAALVKMITSYQAPINQVTSMKGGNRERIAALAAQFDPTFDMSQYRARADMRKSITSGTYSQTLNSANLVIQHLDALSRASDALGNQGGLATPWNQVANPVKRAFGSPEITNFTSATDAVASELAKVFKGTGASSEQEVQEWRKNLDPNSSPEQIKAQVKLLVGDLLKSRLDTVRAQYQSAMGHPADFAFLTPHSREVLTGLGIDPAELDTNGDAAGAPEQTGDVAGSQAPGAAPAAGTPPASMAMPTTKAEYDALPSGTTYQAPDGSMRTKP